MFILEMLKFNILAAIVILITLLISRILKNKYSVRWKYWTWLVIAVLLLLPFHFTALRPVIQVNVPRETSVQMADVQETTGGNGTETTGGSGLKAEYDDYAVSNPQQTNAAASGSEEHLVPDEPLNPAENTVPVENMASEEPLTSEEPLLPAETMMPTETWDTADQSAVDIQVSSVSLLELERWFVYIWIAGIAFVFVVRMLQYIAVKRKLGKYRHRVDTQEVLDTYGRLCRKLGIRKPPVLYHQPALQSPLLTGLVKPALYLPGEAYTAVELELIFLHELHHYQHKDLWYKFFLSLSGMIYWFNPAIWLMRREANRDLEALCDSAVIRSAADSQKSRAYGRLLLQTSMERSFLQQAALGLNDSVTDFKERINYMISAKKRKNGIAVCLILACSLMLANQLVGCASVAAESGSVQTEASSVESSTTSETSASAAETASISQEATSTSETSPASLTPAPTVYETENFTFTLPEIWQGQVTGRIEGEPGATLTLEWKGIQLGWIEVESTKVLTSGDIKLANVWHSEEEGDYCVSLWVQNYAYLLPRAEMDPSVFPEYLTELSNEEKEQLLFLTTGGEVTYAEATDYCQTRDTQGKTLSKTAAFYTESVAPCIAVKDLAALSDIAPTVYETEYFTFTVPEIWQGQVIGLIKEGRTGINYLSLEWKGIPLAAIGVEEKAASVGGDIAHSNIWHSKGQNSNYWVHMSVTNYAFLIINARPGSDEYGNMLSALTDEEKEQLLYLTTGGRVTLENVSEEQSIENTSTFYKESIVPYIEVKELPPREIDTEAAKITTFEGSSFSFTMPEIWKGKVAGRLDGGADYENLILEWKGIHLATITIRMHNVAYVNDGSKKSYGTVWRSEEKDGYQIEINAYNYACQLGLMEVHGYVYSAIEGLSDEDKRELLYLTTGGRLTLEEAIELCRSEDAVEQTHEKLVDFYTTSIAPYIEIKELP